MAHTVLDSDKVKRYVYSQKSGTAGDPYWLNVDNILRGFKYDGITFNHSDEHLVANNNQIKYLFKTPSSSSTVELLYLRVLTTSAPINVSFFEDTIVSANGTAANFLNRNRRSTNTAQSLLYEQPTVTDNGVSIYEHRIIGDKDRGGSLVYNDSIILDYSSNYLLNINNDSGFSSTISVEFVLLEY